jgi:hypothetical protein
MDMHISELKNRLKYPCRICPHFLYSIETTLGDASRECRYLLYTDDTRICDDDDIEFVIDPVNQDKCQKHNPIYSDPSPVESSTYDVHDRDLISYEYPRGHEEREKIEKMKYKDNPMSMKCHEYLLMIF